MQFAGCRSEDKLPYGISASKFRDVRSWIHDPWSGLDIPCDNNRHFLFPFHAHAKETRFYSFSGLNFTFDIIISFPYKAFESRGQSFRYAWHLQSFRECRGFAAE